jgi:hypothetical protein
MARMIRCRSDGVSLGIMERDQRRHEAGVRAAAFRSG